MAIQRSADRSVALTADAQLVRIAEQGCSAHPHLLALVNASGRHLARDLADAVHVLCSLHGRHPGLIEIVQQQGHGDGEWLRHAAARFEEERLLLVRLTAAVGPLPSTPGAAETQASLLGQRHALETLAASERRGCALGAAVALVEDWRALREVLERAAARAGIDSGESRLPDAASVRTVVAGALGAQAIDRAFAFGAEQLLLQHRALFDLLEARAEARGDL